MTEQRRVQGAIERAARREVKNMGGLSDRQKLITEEIFRLAALLDEEPDGSKAAALARELRQQTAGLRASAPVRPEGKLSGDVVTDLQRARENRRGAG